MYGKICGSGTIRVGNICPSYVVKMDINALLYCVSKRVPNLRGDLPTAGTDTNPEKVDGSRPNVAPENSLKITNLSLKLSRVLSHKIAKLFMWIFILQTDQGGSPNSILRVLQTYTMRKVVKDVHITGFKIYIITYYIILELKVKQSFSKQDKVSQPIVFCGIFRNISLWNWAYIPRP